MFNKGDKIVIVSKGNGIPHTFQVGDKGSVIKHNENYNFYLIACNGYPSSQYVSAVEVELDNNTKEAFMKQMKEAVLNAAQTLLKGRKSNKMRSEDLKPILRGDIDVNHFYWPGNVITGYLNELVTDGKLTSTGKRVMVYSDPSLTPTLPKTHNRKTISRTKALELMQNSKGRFFTATFIDKNNEVRVMNCQYLKDQEQSPLGYVKVREAALMRTNPNQCIRSVNLNTLQSLKMGGTNSVKVR